MVDNSEAQRAFQGDLSLSDLVTGKANQAEPPLVERWLYDGQNPKTQSVFDELKASGRDMGLGWLADKPDSGVWGLARSLVAREVAKQAKLQKQGLVQGALSAAGNTPVGMTPGGIYRAATGAETSPSWLPDPTVASMVKGASDINVGGAQLAANVLNRLLPGQTTANLKDKSNRAATDVEQYYRQNYNPSVVGELQGAAIPMILGGEATAPAKAQQVTGFIRNAVKYGKGIPKAAVIGAGSAMLTPETQVKDDAEYWSRKAVKATTGAELGALGAATLPLALPALKWAGRKSAEIYAGTPLEEYLVGKFGDRLKVPTKINPNFIDRATGESPLDLSRKLDEAGITEHTPGMLTGDFEQAAWESSLAKKDPVFANKLIKANQQATEYADNVLNGLRSAMKAERWNNLADVKAAAEAGGKRSPEARMILNVIENSGEDWAKIAQAGGKLELFLKKLEADKLYDDFGRAAAAVDNRYGIADALKPSPRIQVANYESALKREIGALKSNRAADQGQIPYLEGLLDDVKKGKNLDFESLRNTRTLINRKITALMKPNSTVQDADGARDAFLNLSKSIEKDIDTYGMSRSPEARAKWIKARDYYKNEVIPYKQEADVSAALMDEDPTTLARLFRGKDKYAQQRMIMKIGNKGKAAVQFGLIDDAVMAGEKTQRGTQSPTMSAARVAGKLEALDKAGSLDVAFKGSDRMAVEGMTRILRMVDKADNVAWTPPTGEATERVGGRSMELTANPVKLASKGVNWLNRRYMRWLYSNPKGKALLIRASGLPENSKMLRNIVDVQIPALIGREANIPTYNARKPEDEEAQ